MFVPDEDGLYVGGLLFVHGAVLHWFEAIHWSQTQDEHQKRSYDDEEEKTNKVRRSSINLQVKRLVRAAYGYLDNVVPAMQ